MTSFLERGTSRALLHHFEPVVDVPLLQYAPVCSPPPEPKVTLTVSAFGSSPNEDVARALRGIYRFRDPSLCATASSRKSRRAVPEFCVQAIRRPGRRVVTQPTPGSHQIHASVGGCCSRGLVVARHRISRSAASVAGSAR